MFRARAVGARRSPLRIVHAATAGPARERVRDPREDRASEYGLTIRQHDERDSARPRQNDGRNRLHATKAVLFVGPLSVEHRLLTATSMRLIALTSFTLLATLSGPSSAFAQMTPTFAAFGTHGANSDLVVQPLGASDCATPITFTMSPTVNSATTRYIDVWSASSISANCQIASTRASTTADECTHVGGIAYLPTNMTATVSITPAELFGTCETATRSFFFFDTTASDDVSTTLTTYWVITAELDTISPLTPVITSTPVGDASLQITWNASDFTSLGPEAQVDVYAAAGCSGASADGSGVDAGLGGTLVAGGTAPSTHLLRASAVSPITLDTALLGWSTSHYGETVAMAIAAVDSSGNISPLSNVVCAEHVAPPAPPPSGCSCSVGRPRRRSELGAAGLALGALAALIGRRVRR